MATFSTTTAPGLMLETGLKQWLDREESPSDFYQLVGQPRLCANRDLLLDCLEEASEYLFQCQNHKDKRIRDRARKFSRQLAEARRTLSDESRWEQYDADLITRLHVLYRKNPNFSGPTPKLEDLKRWLALVQQVDPNRVEELVAAWTSAAAQQDPATKPTSKPSPPEMETQSRAANKTEELPKIRERRDSPHSVGHIHEPSSDDSDAYQLADVSSVPEEARSSQSSRRPTPPPPPLRDASSGTRPLSGNGNGKAPPPPPPPPPKDVPPQPQPQPPARPQIRTAAPEMRSSEFPRRRPTHHLPGSPALWIGMAALLTALVLGLFGLVLAWAAGAFDGKRSRGAISREESSFVLQQRTPSVPPPSRQWGGPTGSVNRRDLSTKHSA